MPSVEQEVQIAIESWKVKDPRLYSALNLLNQQLQNLTRKVEPLIIQSEAPEDSAVTDSISAPTATYIFTGTTVRIIWSQSVGAIFYEIRKGTDWDTALFQFRTSNLQADVDPLLEGDHTYLIKSVDIDGNYSTTTFTLTVSVPPILVVPVTGTVIDNNILISWTPPESAFNIRHYEVYRDGVLLGNQFGTFFTRFEVVSGIYEYSVIAVDIAENRSPESVITLTVSQPPDFVLFDVFISTLNGTYVNAKMDATPEPDQIVAPINLTESWQDHFINNSWANIQAQINAGYPIYIQPSNTASTPDASYEEVVDYGTTIGSSIVAVTYNHILPSPSDDVTVVIKMATSTDNITYSAFSSGAVQFRTAFRYIKYKLEFTAANNKALILVFELTFNISVKRENDGGEVAAVSTDVSGTSVAFNKAFKDIESITATVKASTTATAIVNFVDIPNPTGFSVYAFNSAGTRISATVEWAARGIL